MCSATLPTRAYTSRACSSASASAGLAAFSVSGPWRRIGTTRWDTYQIPKMELSTGPAGGLQEKPVMSSGGNRSADGDTIVSTTSKYLSHKNLDRRRVGDHGPDRKKKRIETSNYGYLGDLWYSAT